MPLTNAACAGLLNRFGSKTSLFDTLQDLYAAASTTTPSKDGTGFTEPVGNNYSRRLIDPSELDAATVADPSLLTNNATLAHNAASGSWGTITYVGLFTAASSGTLLGFGQLSEAKAIGLNDVLRYTVGELDLTLT